jgi:hypothetical protein
MVYGEKPEILTAFSGVLMGGGAAVRAMQTK